MVYLRWCSAVWRDVSAVVFRGVTWCICCGVARSGVMYLPWCFVVYLSWCSAVLHGVSAVVFCGLAWCICSGVPQSSVVYLPRCSAVWRGVSVVVFL